MTAHVQRTFPTDDTSWRLQLLSDEVSEIASVLARLSSGSPKRSVNVAAPNVALSPDIVKDIQKARRLRERFFDAELFSDPAWDILLELFHSELCQHRVAVSSLCIAANVPTTTALRWITAMTDSGLLCRKPDPHDRRRAYVELSPYASSRMRHYFSILGEQSAT